MNLVHIACSQYQALTTLSEVEHSFPQYHSTGKLPYPGLSSEEDCLVSPSRSQTEKVNTYERA